LRQELVDRTIWNRTLLPTAHWCVAPAARWIRDVSEHNKEIIASLEIQLRGTNEPLSGS
jgi:hypothetical protein